MDSPGLSALSLEFNEFSLIIHVRGDRKVIP
jgi:hypothetical protein